MKDYNITINNIEYIVIINEVKDNLYSLCLGDANDWLLYDYDVIVTGYLTIEDFIIQVINEHTESINKA